MKTVVSADTCLRQWSKLQPDIRMRLQVKLEAYAAIGAGDVKALKARDGARLRVGDWRVVFMEDATEITVVLVGHRRDVYD